MAPAPADATSSVAGAQFRTPASTTRSPASAVRTPPHENRGARRAERGDFHWIQLLTETTYRHFAQK
jgi:hypothetical protein